MPTPITPTFAGITTIDGSHTGITAIALGDFYSADGNLDVAYSAVTSTTLLADTGNGSGGLSSLNSLTTTYAPYGLAVDDVSGSTKQDVVAATTNNTSSTLLVLFPNTGTFDTLATIAISGTSAVHSVAAGDLGRSGGSTIDLVALDNLTGVATVYINDGSGSSFTTGSSYAMYGSGSATGPVAIALATLDSNSTADLLAVNSVTNELSVRLNSGADSFGSLATYSTGSGTSPQALAVGKLDSGSSYDVVTANQNGTVSVLLGNGGGTFGTATQYTLSGAPTPYSVALGDINGDGNIDIVTANSVGSGISYLLGNGDGTFGNGGTATVSGAAASVGIGDFNKDGYNDILVGTANGLFLLNNTTVTPPTITGVLDQTGASNTDGISNNGYFTVNGSAHGSDTVVLYDGATSIASTAASGGVWSYYLNGLSAGSHTITAAVGGQFSSARVLTVDSTAASISGAALKTSGGTSVDNAYLVGASTLIYSGSTEAGAAVTLYDNGTSVGGGQTTADGSGNFNVTTPLLSVGSTHTFTAAPADLAGNPSTYLGTPAGPTVVTIVGSAPAVSLGGVVNFIAPTGTSLDLSTGSTTFAGVTGLGLPPLTQLTLNASTLTTSLASQTTLNGAISQFNLGGSANSSAIDLSGVTGLNNLDVLNLSINGGGNAVTVGGSSAGPARVVSNTTSGIAITAMKSGMQLFGGGHNDSLIGKGNAQTIIGALGPGASISASGDNDVIFLNDPAYAYSVAGSSSGQSISISGNRALLVGRRATDSASHAVSLTGSDTVQLSGTTGQDTVLGQNGAMNVTIYNGANHVIIGGSAALSVSSYAGSVSGSAGGDTIFGGSGATSVNLAGFGATATTGDTIVAGSGSLSVTTSRYISSLIFAGSGADTITLTQASTVTGGAISDTIADFQAGTDKLDLSQIGIVSADQFAALTQTQLTGGVALKLSDRQEVRITGISSLSIADVHLGAASV